MMATTTTRSRSAQPWRLLRRSLTASEELRQMNILTNSFSNGSMCLQVCLDHLYV